MVIRAAIPMAVWINSRINALQLSERVPRPCNACRIWEPRRRSCMYSSVHRLLLTCATTSQPTQTGWRRKSPAGMKHAAAISSLLWPVCRSSRIWSMTGGRKPSGCYLERCVIRHLPSSEWLVGHCWLWGRAIFTARARKNI